jgi:phytoene synthase
MAQSAWLSLSAMPPTQAAPTSPVWSQAEWARLARLTATRAAASASDDAAWQLIVKQARAVLRQYSTSFFIVTRFLPAAKRAQVEAIYAAVRYPDEIVDTFPLNQSQRTQLLDEWAAHYETALGMQSVREMLRANVPPFVAAFVKVVHDTNIPREHYRAFLEAMRLDVWPRPFQTLEDLIDFYCT